MAKGEIVIRKVWRSELKRVIVFFVLCGGSIAFSRLLPASVIRGVLFRYGDTTVYLALPLFWLVPFCFLSLLLVKIYDCRYLISSRGIEAREGILSLNQTVTRVRYEDIRGVETVQSIWDRVLDVGKLEISTSATGGVEIAMHGVASPKEIQDVLIGERDRRQQLAVAGAQSKQSANS